MLPKSPTNQLHLSPKPKPRFRLPKLLSPLKRNKAHTPDFLKPRSMKELALLFPPEPRPPVMTEQLPEEERDTASVKKHEVPMKEEVGRGKPVEVQKREKEKR